MPKMVGLSRNIKMPWLNKTVELEAEDLTIEEKKALLNEYLSFEIESPTNLRKTREILLNVWTNENEYSPKLKEDALQLVKKYPEDRMMMHWCMMLAAYPVFVDVCRLIGKMSEFQDELTTAQIKKKLYDEWGERSTLHHSLDKLLATLVDLGALIRKKPGKYHVARIPVDKPDVADFMVYAVMLIDDAGYYSMQELRDFDHLFPFQYDISREQVTADQRFETSNFGGQMTVAVRG